jgi:hypothetical protein
MQLFFSFIGFLLVTAGCQSSANTNETLDDTSYRQQSSLKKDTALPQPPKAYDGLNYVKVELLQSAPGTKSVLFNSAGSKLYAMNLEGMSVYEFDQPSRKITREFKFKPTKGTGWDYAKDKPIPSFQENPWKPASATTIKYYGYRSIMQKALYPSGSIQSKPIKKCIVHNL